MVRISLRRKRSLLTDRYQLGTTTQVLELEMIYSGAFFDCHAIVFLGTAPNSGVTEQEMGTNYFVEEVSE